MGFEAIQPSLLSILTALSESLKEGSAYLHGSCQQHRLRTVRSWKADRLGPLPGGEDGSNRESRRTGRREEEMGKREVKEWGERSGMGRVKGKRERRGKEKRRGKEGKSRWEVGEEWHNTGYEHTVEIPFYFFFSPYPAFFPSSPPSPLSSLLC